MLRPTEFNLIYVICEFNLVYVNTITHTYHNINR